MECRTSGVMRGEVHTDLPEPMFNIKVLSDVNLSEFIHWASKQSEETFEFYSDRIVKSDHTRYLGESPENIVQQDGRTLVRSVGCTNVGCDRCGIGPPWAPGGMPGPRGGYSFQYTGPWTVRAVVPDGFTPNEWRAIGSCVASLPTAL